MTKTIQVRNVPEEVHHRLVVRAAEERKSLSELVLGELVVIAGKLTRKEMQSRFEALEPVELEHPAAEWIREGRDEREQKIEPVRGEEGSSPGGGA